MPAFALPPADPDAKPEFRDAAGCAAWLQALPLINVATSHGRLLAQIGELNRCAIAPAERVKVLEQLREAVLFVQTELAKKFSNRPVPLSAQEREAFSAVVALWSALLRGFQYGLEGGADAAQAALACQRAQWCLSEKLGEHYAVYQEIAAGEWSLLNRLYAIAE